MYKDRKKQLSAQRRYNESHREERKLLAKKWRIENKNKKRQYDRVYYKKYILIPKNKFKNDARKKLRYAVKSGKIKRGKCFCGERKVQGHHDDYLKPFDVKWLCRKHHEEIHHS